MPGTGDALRRTSDSMLRDIEALAAARGREAHDPIRATRAGRPGVRSIEIRSPSAMLASSTSQRAQTAVIHDAHRGRLAGPRRTRPIEDTPRSMEAILAAWRQAERQLDAAGPALPRPRRRGSSSISCDGVPAGARRGGEPGPLTVAGSPRGAGWWHPRRDLEPATFRLEGGCSVHWSYGDSAGW